MHNDTCCPLASGDFVDSLQNKLPAPISRSSLLPPCSVMIALGFFLFGLAHATIFVESDKRLLRFGVPPACNSTTLVTEAWGEISVCSLACSLRTDCFAFALDASRACWLFPSLCKPPSWSDSFVVMQRPREVPLPATPNLIWRFGNWQFLMTQSRGSFQKMQELCARYEM